jgi:hypothetical protein
VEKWMKEHDLDGYLEQFKENKVDGRALAELKHWLSLQQLAFFEHMCERMGIIKTGDLLRFSSAIRNL